MKNMSQC